MRASLQVDVRQALRLAIEVDHSIDDYDFVATFDLLGQCSIGEVSVSASAG